jgi:hypothetical protein
MPRTRHYVHRVASGQPIDSAPETLATVATFDRDRLTLIIEASVASDFALEVQMEPGGSFTTFKTYTGTDSVAETLDLVAHSVRVQNTTAQTAGDTATVKLGAE